MGVRFDPAARKAIDAAMIEVERRGHATLDPTHMLAGLLQSGVGEVAAALAAIGVNVEALRGAAAASLRDGGAAVGETVDVAASTERILERASAIASERLAESVSDLDILFAVAERGDATAGAILKAHGVTTERLLPSLRAAATTARHSRGPGSPAPRTAPAIPPRDAGRAPHVITRAGIGYDSHRFAAGGPLILGGIEIPADVHLVGHSDGDAVSHALTDAVLGAAGAGDIGEMFPDADPANRGRHSLEMLRGAVQRVRALGWAVQQADVTVVAERPRIASHREAMRTALAAALGVPPGWVGLKGKTNEGMGWIGRGEGLACLAVATLVTARSDPDGG